MNSEEGERSLAESVQLAASLLRALAAHGVTPEMLDRVVQDPSYRRQVVNGFLKGERSYLRFPAGVDGRGYAALAERVFDSTLKWRLQGTDLMSPSGLRFAAEELSDAHLTVLVLRYGLEDGHQWGIQQIAEYFEQPQSWVGTALSLATKQIRARLTAEAKRLRGEED